MNSELNLKKLARGAGLPAQTPCRANERLVLALCSRLVAGSYRSRRGARVRVVTSQSCADHTRSSARLPRGPASATCLLASPAASFRRFIPDAVIPESHASTGRVGSFTMPNAIAEVARTADSPSAAITKWTSVPTLRPAAVMIEVRPERAGARGVDRCDRRVLEGSGPAQPVEPLAPSQPSRQFPSCAAAPVRNWLLIDPEDVAGRADDPSHRRPPNLALRPRVWLRGFDSATLRIDDFRAEIGSPPGGTGESHRQRPCARPASLRGDIDGRAAREPNRVERDEPYIAMKGFALGCGDRDLDRERRCSSC